jgi:uncharacterized membrane protein YccC
MSSERPDAWSAFWRTVIRFQSDKLTPWLALRNALGVALPLAAGVALGQVAVGLAIATGALNVSFSDGQEPYAQRARRMLAASGLVGLAVFAGELAGHHAAAAVLVATGWAFAAGMMVSLSTTAADLGVISLVTLVVYAASPQSLDRAIFSGLFAMLGGLFQTMLALAFWPLRRYGPERRALAELYLKLADAADKPFEASLSPPASAESTAAQNALRTLDQVHSVESERFRLLLSQAERIRLSLLMLARLRTRIGREHTGGMATGLLTRFLQTSSKILAIVGESLEEGEPAQSVPDCQQELTAVSEALRTLDAAESEAVATMVQDARFQTDALAGQLRSAVDLAAYATAEGLAAFDRREARRPWRLRLEGPMATLRANLNLQSAAFRHAMRLAACVGLGELLGRTVSLHRAYWLPMTIAIVLKPDFTATFSRGVLRLAGTFAGLLFATGLFHILPPGLGMEVIAIAALMYALRWLGPANYGLFVTAVTALVVLLIAMTGVTPKDVMLARGLNTAAGGAIALAAYALWPTWERTQVREALAQLLDAYRTYFRAIRDSYEHPRAARSPELDLVRLPGRLARSNLEASVDRLLAEPGTNGDTAAVLAAILASSHRLVHAMMALEAGLASSHPVPPRASFAPFANDVELTLYYLAASLRGSSISAGELPNLREAHNLLVHSGDALTERYALVNVETDRITNSLNTLAGDITRLLGR